MKILKKINEERVESEKGFSIRLIGLEQLRYKDGNCTIDFEWNYDPKSNKTYIFLSDSENLTFLEKKQIINNIKEAVKLCGSAQCF